MSDFNLAIPVILKHEVDPKRGPYVDNAADRGGPTNWGITLATLQELRPGATIADLKAMTQIQAEGIYRERYWQPPNLAAVSSQVVATKLLDMGVNMGLGEMAKLAQRSVRRLGDGVPVDGDFGPITLAAVNRCDPDSLIYALVSAQRAFYQALVAARPADAAFLEDWLTRAEWGLAEVEALT